MAVFKNLILIDKYGKIGTNKSADTFQKCRISILEEAVWREFYDK